MNQAEGALGVTQPEAIVFADDGMIPNSRLPLLLYRRVFPADAPGLGDAIEERFAANRWGRLWRDTVFPFPHYHSTSHEVLGVYRGAASLLLPTEHSSMTESIDAGWGGSGYNPRRKIGAAVLAAWSRRDPTAAGEWAKSAQADPQWSSVMGPYPLGQAVDRLSDHPGGRIAADPATEGARALAMPVSDKRTTVLRKALRAMADKDPAASRSVD